MKHTDSDLLRELLELDPTLSENEVQLRKLLKLLSNRRPAVEVNSFTRSTLRTRLMEEFQHTRRPGALPALLARLKQPWIRRALGGTIAGCVVLLIGLHFIQESAQKSGTAYLQKYPDGVNYQEQLPAVILQSEKKPDPAARPQQSSDKPAMTPQKEEKQDSFHFSPQSQDEEALSLADTDLSKRTEKEASDTLNGKISPQEETSPPSQTFLQKKSAVLKEKQAESLRSASEQTEPVIPGPKQDLLKTVDYPAARLIPGQPFQLPLFSGSRDFIRQWSLASWSQPYHLHQWVNSFSYSDKRPLSGLSVTSSLIPAPWNPAHLLLQIRVQSPAIQYAGESRVLYIFLHLQTASARWMAQDVIFQIAKNLGPREAISLAAMKGSTPLILPPTRDPVMLLRLLDQIPQITTSQNSLALAETLALTADTEMRSPVPLVFLTDQGLAAEFQSVLSQLHGSGKMQSLELSLFNLNPGLSAMSITRSFPTGLFKDSLDTTGWARLYNSLSARLRGAVPLAARQVQISFQADAGLVDSIQLPGNNRALSYLEGMPGEAETDIPAGYQQTWMFVLQPRSGIQTLPGQEIGRLNISYLLDPGNRQVKMTTPVSYRVDSWASLPPAFSWSAAMAWWHLSDTLNLTSSDSALLWEFFQRGKSVPASTLEQEFLQRLSARAGMKHPPAK